jgi:hypothetical protein
MLQQTFDIKILNNFHECSYMFNLFQTFSEEQALSIPKGWLLKSHTLQMWHMWFIVMYVICNTDG